jgi:hypothetical protein
MTTVVDPLVINALEVNTPSQIQTLCSVTHQLYNQGACVRCSIRFLSIHQVKLFNASEQALVDFYHKHATPEQSITYPRQQPTCILCLGLLQNNSDGELRFKTQLINTVRDCGYQYDDFQFTVTVPHSSVIRETCLLKQLAEEHRY